MVYWRSRLNLNLPLSSNVVLDLATVKGVPTLYSMMESAPVFRAPKRRKFFKSTAEDVDEPQVDAHHGSSSDGELEVGVVRKSKTSRAPKKGMTFSNTVVRNREEESALALLQAEPSSGGFKDMSNRFVSSTGQVVDVDKHMYVSPKLIRVLLEARPLT
jgi:hypothetical protein